MNRQRIQRSIGTLIVLLLSVAVITVAYDRLIFKHRSVLELLLDFSFQFDVIVLAIMTALTLWVHRWAQWAIALVVFGSSGVVILTSSSSSYFGLGTIVLGTLLMQRFGMLEKYFVWKTVGIVLWTLGFIFAADQYVFSVSLGTSFSTFAFVAINVLALYILFEEEIRDLLVANKLKDAELAEQAAEIARLEPLSVLGERVAHVAHSFKNNLSLVGTALYYLEMNETEKAAKKIKDFSKTMNERIDNILMVSRAGAEQVPELFDAARMLAGLNQVYLTEPAFLQRAKVELDANEPTPVFAARWDFLLMAENILKNALEALTTKGGYGNIRVSLKDRLFTLANDGGAMALCSECREDCLRCPRYGKPGQTTKAGGSGHGLAQVFTTCRKYGWTLRIKTDGDWTLFEIGLTKSTGGLSAPLPL